MGYISLKVTEKKGVLLSKFMQPKLCIKQWRINRGISQAQLAKRTHMSQSYLSELEANTKYPSIPMLYRIANVLEICPQYLLGCELRICDNCYLNKEDAL